MRNRLKNLGYILLFLVVFLIPIFVKEEYFLHILIIAGFFYMLVVGLNLMVGYLGQLSLGHTAFLGIGAYTSALLQLKLNAPFWVSFLATILISSAVSLLLGIVILRLRGPYFVIVTLCFSEMLLILANNGVVLTNGPMGLPGVAPPIIYIPFLGAYEFEGKDPYYYMMIILVIFMTYTVHRLVNSSTGRACIALRENENLAESVGISAFRFGMIVFVTASVFAGIAGSFYAHYVSYINPEIFGFTYMVTMLVMLVTGGKGTITGPLVGCILFTILPEILRGAEKYRMPVFGIILIIVAIFFPQGLKGLMDKIVIYIKGKLEG
jgi:branched-chain amino acid transport system permease protein